MYVLEGGVGGVRDNPVWSALSLHLTEALLMEVCLSAMFTLHSKTLYPLNSISSFT